MKKLLLTVLASLFLFSCTQKKETAPEVVTAPVDSLKIKLDAATKILAEKDAKDSAGALVNTKGPGVRSKESAFITDQLRAQPELIPLKAVHGGTMRFGTIEVISKEWLLATYEDGHIQGRAIYSYRLSKKGAAESSVVFTLVTSTND